MTGSWYGPVPVTGIGKLSVPCQNAAGESPAATAWLPLAPEAPRAAGGMTVATLPRVAGRADAAASGSASAAAAAATTSRDRAGPAPGLPRPRAPVISDLPPCPYCELR